MILPHRSLLLDAHSLIDPASFMTYQKLDCDLLGLGSSLGMTGLESPGFILCSVNIASLGDLGLVKCLSSKPTAQGCCEASLFQAPWRKGRLPKGKTTFLDFNEAREERLNYWLS